MADEVAERERPEATTLRTTAADVFSGVGLGLLLGVIVGMSRTPTVATVVGALSSILAIFLGLDVGAQSNLPLVGKIQINGVRIGSFGLATIAGLFIGLFVRVNNPIAVAPSEQLLRWEAAFPVEVAPATTSGPGEQAVTPTGSPGVRYALDADEARNNRLLARQMMIYERTGLVPAGLAFGAGAAPAPDASKAAVASVDAGEGTAPGADEAKADDTAGGTTFVAVTQSTGSRGAAELYNEGLEADLCKALGPEAQASDKSWLIAFRLQELSRVLKQVDETKAQHPEDEARVRELLTVASATICDLRDRRLRERERLEAMEQEE